MSWTQGTNTASHAGCRVYGTSTLLKPDGAVVSDVFLIIVHVVFAQFEMLKIVCRYR